MKPIKNNQKFKENPCQPKDFKNLKKISANQKFRDFRQIFVISNKKKSKG